jgi:hypothetical protein
VGGKKSGREEEWEGRSSDMRGCTGGIQWRGREGGRKYI